MLIPMLSLAMAIPANAAAYRTDTGFTTNKLAAFDSSNSFIRIDSNGRTDDGSSGLVALGFTANFFGLTANQVYLNNNGNITFTGPLSTFTPFNLVTTGTPIIAPFFADVDTRNAASGVLTYGTSTVNGHAAFGVDWAGVGHYNQSGAPFDTFQVVLIDRSDIAQGDFDFEFNYGSIGWDTTSSTPDGSARVGYSNGSSNSFELAGSGTTGAFLDGGPNALQTHSLNSNVAGRYVFNARSGNVDTPPSTVPDSGVTWALLLGSLGLLEAGRRLGCARPA